MVDIAIVINAAVITSVDSHGGGDATSYLTRSGAMSKQRPTYPFPTIHTRVGIALEFRGDCPFLIAIVRFKSWT